MYMSRLKLHRMPLFKTLSPTIKKLPKTITLPKDSRKKTLSLVTSWRRRMMQSLPTTSAISWKNRLRGNSNSLMRSRLSRVWLEMSRRRLVKTKRRVIRKIVNRRTKISSKFAKWTRDKAEWSQATEWVAMPHQWWYLLLILLLIIRATRTNRTNQALQTKANKIEACASNQATSQVASKTM